MAERHRLASRLSEILRRDVDIAVVDYDAFAVKERDLGIASDAACRAAICYVNCHHTGTGKSLCIAGEDTQLIACTWKK
jgi:hypothetical protein